MTDRARRTRVTMPATGRRRQEADRAAVSALLPHRLHPPRSLVAPIERRVLLGRIEEGLAGQVVALRAPAGFGKTELLAAAFHHLRRPADRFGWMTLDEADADPSVFLHDLGAAVSLAQRPATAGLRTAIAAEASLSNADVDAMIATLRTAVLADPAPLILFLDDFHAPRSPAFRRCFEQVLRRLPDSVHVVLACRGQPDIPMSRLRTRNLVTEIGPGDLAFTRGELQRLLGGALSPEDTNRAMEATAGWPALVHLSLPNIRDGSDRQSRSDVLTGQHPLFRDFLEEELLADLPDRVREALEVCSILDCFPLELLADLAGLDVGPAITAMIDTYGPMIEPLPHRPNWLQLHPIVRVALQARSAVQRTVRSAALHVRAASWFAERGILDKAVRHASHAGDFALAVEAIRRAGGVNIFLRAGYTVLTRLLADLPSAVIHQSPTLRLCHALVLSKEGQIHAAREIIDDLKRAGAAAADPIESAPIPPADLEHIDGMIDIYEDKRLEGEQIDKLEHASHDYGAYDSWERGWIYNHLCIAYQRKGDIRAARLTGLRALSCYREEKTPYAQIFMMGHVGTVLMASGRLPAAIKLLREADNLVQETQWSDRNIAALVHIPLATSLYHQGLVVDAAQLLSAAMPVVSRGEGWVDMFARGFGTLARAKFLTDGLEAGLAVLDDAEVLAVERALPRLETSTVLTRVELLTRGGLLESAAQLLAQLPSIDAPDDGIADAWPTMRERHEAWLARTRLLLRLGQIAEGLALAHRTIAAARNADAGLDLLSGQALAIEAHWAHAEPEAALKLLQEAIAFAIPQKAIQVMRSGDAAFATVLRALIRRYGLMTFRPDGAAFLAGILGPLKPQRIGDLSSSASVILTTREAEVLAGLESGLPNKQIARDRGLTEAAVKFHLKNLFRKLGVSRRAMALSVARNVGLL